jgi:hypothetical protein
MSEVNTPTGAQRREKGRRCSTVPTGHPPGDDHEVGLRSTQFLTFFQILSAMNFAEFVTQLKSSTRDHTVRFGNDVYAWDVGGLVSDADSKRREQRPY